MAELSAGFKAKLDGEIYNRYCTPELAVQRALSQLMAIPTPPDPSVPDSGGRPIAYRLEPGFNGGANLDAEHCASWSFGGRTPTADCIAFVMWASRLARHQKNYNGSTGHWLNTDSLWDDAHGAEHFCGLVADGYERPGDWLLTKSKDGKRGHIGMVLRRGCEWFVDGETRQRITTPILVIDCSPRHGDHTSIGIGGPWSGRCKVVRYKHYAR